MISLRFRPEDTSDWTTVSFLGPAEDLAAQELVQALGDYVVELRRGSTFCGWKAAEEFEFQTDEEDEI